MALRLPTPEDLRHGIRADCQVFHAITDGLRNGLAIILRSAGDFPGKDLAVAGQEDNIGEGTTDVYADPVIRLNARVLKWVGWQGACR